MTEQESGATPLDDFEADEVTVRLKLNDPIFPDEEADVITDFVLMSHGIDSAEIVDHNAEALSSTIQRWDTRLEESDLRKRAETAWGGDAQLNKAAEEFSELAAAVNRTLNGQQDRDELLEEFTDARIMLWQLARMFPEDELDEALEDALGDLEHRLEVFG